jgi:hypothetical protein
MFGESNSENTKNLISIKNSIKPLGLYGKNYKLIEKYSNQVELAKNFVYITRLFLKTLNQVNKFPF